MNKLKLKDKGLQEISDRAHELDDMCKSKKPKSKSTIFDPPSEVSVSDANPELLKIFVEAEVCQCTNCNCMTHTVNGRCGKCNAEKPVFKEETFESIYNLKNTRGSLTDKEVDKLKELHDQKIEELKLQGDTDNLNYLGERNTIFLEKNKQISELQSELKETQISYNGIVEIYNKILEKNKELQARLERQLKDINNKSEEIRKLKIKIEELQEFNNKLKEINNKLINMDKENKDFDIKELEKEIKELKIRLKRYECIECHERIEHCRCLK